MFKQYGYTIKSDFFNTPWFKLLYLYGFFNSDTTKFSYKLGAPSTFGLDNIDLNIYIHPYGTLIATPVVKGTNIPCLCSSPIKFHALFYDPMYPDYPYPYEFDAIISANSTGYTEVTGLQFISATSADATITEKSLSYLPSPAGTTVFYQDGDKVDFQMVFDPIADVRAKRFLLWCKRKIHIWCLP